MNHNKRLFEYLASPLMKVADEELRTQHLEPLKTGQRGPLSPEATMVRGMLIRGIYLGPYTHDNHSLDCFPAGCWRDKQQT